MEDVQIFDQFGVDPFAVNRDTGPNFALFDTYDEAVAYGDSLIVSGDVESYQIQKRRVNERVRKHSIRKGLYMNIAPKEGM
jgi:hypothetical protein